ncbi:thiol reductant ABC exporter subunit CydC [Arcanobacterium urinimassiliense]|uniref:thiol reductant ABC exporter subunit CydC n=1 Tax=Arcanobacterium urinimassiliense TaxID=1871014 RepID=UPI00093D348E|nr:thiol reductant ABC exporter subunit CydC [Arcanobacterium urinimassiliense]
MTESIFPPAERAALRRILHMLEIDKKRFGLSIVLGSGAIGSGVGLGAVSAWLIARAAQLPPVLDLSIAATSVRAFGVGKAIFRYLERISSHRVSLNGMAALRTQVYSQLADSPTDVVASIRRGDLLARTGSDVDEIGQVVVKSLLPAAIAVVTSLISIAIVSALCLPIGLVLAFCLLLSGLAGPYFAARSARRAEINQVKERSQLNIEALTLLESASELRVSGKLSHLEAAQQKTEKLIQQNRNKAAFSTAFASAIDVFALGISVIAAILIGSGQVLNGNLSAVGLVVCTLTPLSAFESTQRLPDAAIQLVRSARAALRITELLDTGKNTATNSANDEVATELHSPAPSTPMSSTPVTSEAATSTPTTPVTSTPLTNTPLLEAKDIVLGWPSGPDLSEKLNLRLVPGKTIAIVGASGIGKSTLLYTLAGMIRPHQGVVEISGADIAALERTTVADKVTLTAEDAHIFHTSVLENLRVARADITPEEAVELLEAAGLGEWLAQLPEGVETVLGENSRTLSGGERRRILLARAFASPADFFLLDEPGEHLDSATADKLIRDLLAAGNPPLSPQMLASAEVESTATATDTSEENKKISSIPAKQRGVILVTHRLHPLDAADEVIVLGEHPARILARGTHKEVMQQLPIYRWSAEQE